MPIPGADWYMTQQVRLHAFLRWLVPIVIAFGILEGIAFVFFQDRAFGIASLTTFSCLGCLLFAQAQLRRGRLQLAAIIVYSAFLGAALIGAFTWPNLISMLVFLPILAIVIILPYVTRRLLYGLIAIGWFVIMGIVILDEIQPASSTAPSWIISLFRVSSLGAAAALLLILMVQFSNRLIEMLTNTEQANASLRATQAQLEAQQEHLQRTLREREDAIVQHRAVEERLAALSEAANTLLSFPHQRHVLPAILDLARQAISADAYAVWRVHPTLPEWRIVSAVGLSEDYQQRAARALNETRVAPAEATAIADTETSPALVTHRREEYRREGIRALLVMPLRIHGEIGGTLVFYYRQPHPFSELEIRVATALSHLAAAALSTAELYDEQHQLRMEAEAAQRDLAFLVEASGILGASLDYPTTLANIARLAVPELADWCGVYLIDDAGTVQELAVAHQDQAKAELVREISRRYPPAPRQVQGLIQVIRTGQPVIVPDFGTVIEEIAEDAEHLQLLRSLGITSYLLSPLQVGDHPLGVLTFGREDPLRSYGSQDLALVQELAQRAAMAVEHARLYRAAQDAIRQREQFLSIASHELKTPLTSIIGFAELLQRRTMRDGSLKERDQRTLRLIREQARRLEQLIGTLLDVSRIETGQLRLERASVDLVALMEGMVAALQPTLEHHSLIFQSADQSMVVDGDSLRLEQVMHNLIGNAIKYSPSGGTITVQVERNRSTGIITVVDQGMGIPSAAIPHLFQRFYRAPNVDSQHISGMGIGLYVVKEIVALHGGSISVSSQEGVGSTFTVELPLAGSYQPMSESLASGHNNRQVAAEN